MSACNLPSFSFLFAFGGLPAFGPPAIPTFTAAFSLGCPLD